MTTTRTKKHVLDPAHLLARLASGVSAEDRLLRTPTAEEWSETSLSRPQLDAALRKGRVHRGHGQT
jgi:hypothetical protein